VASLILLILAWCIVAVGCCVGFLLIRQYGRILLRLEAIEQQLARLDSLDQAAAAAPPAPVGLPWDSPAPDFELPSLAGKRVSLTEYRGQRVLLVFFNPTCGYCVQMAPDLAQLPVSGRAGAPIPLVITTGDLEANRRLVREHQIRCPVLLQTQNEVGGRYRVQGTPQGYLIDEQGRIASETAVGAQAVLALALAPSVATGRAVADGSARTGAGDKTYRGNLPLTASKIRRDGLTAGTRAPDFRLPRLDGGQLSLADLRGRKVLLVFSDPDCGPCNYLAPKLEELHRSRPDLTILMVSRGKPEANSKKVAEHGLTFPVVLQKQWEVSRDYAMFATPAGYLVDANGILASDAAPGAESILALAARASSSTPTEEGVHMVS